MTVHVFPHTLFMPISLPLLALSLVQTAAAAGVAGDACAPLVPPALANKIATDFSAYQLPSSSDLGEARNKDLNNSGDWPCPFIVLGDFDGNGALDRAVLLKNRQSGAARLIAAMNANGQWQITLSEEWPLALVDTDLRPMEAGFYQRAEAIKQPVEQLDQLPSLQVEYSAFSAGKLNSGYAIYGVISGKWQKLTMQDQ